MDELERLFFETLQPVLVPFLAGVGAIALLVLRRRLWAMFTAWMENGRTNGGSAPSIPAVAGGSGGGATAAAADLRRRDDQLLDRVLQAYEQNTRALTQLVETQRDIAQALQALGARTDKLQEHFDKKMDDGHGRIHDRLDTLLARPAHG